MTTRATVAVAVADIQTWLGRLDGLRVGLDPDERRRAGAFTDPSAEARFVLAHALLRSMVGAALGRHPGERPFEHDAAGRPRPLDPTAADVRWSLSHSGDLVVVALARGVDLGVDVEAIDPRRADLATALRYLPPSASQAIVALRPSDRPARIALAWTCLEAEAKGRGLALDDLRGRERTGVVQDLAVGGGHVATLWTAGPATIVGTDLPLLASVA